MTRIQRTWAMAAVLAGALLGCVVVLSAGGSMPLAPTGALLLLALALFAFATWEASRP